MTIINVQTAEKRKKEYDIIIVGCGFCGSVVARLAAELGHTVLMIERRNHIAGNAFDELDENGIYYQRYGAHVFYTNEEWIYQFVTRFDNWYHPTAAGSGVEIDGTPIPSPFGFPAIRLLYPKEESEELIAKLLREYQGRDSVPVLEMMESADKDIAAFANMIYEKDCKLYAAKQWNLDPRKLDKSVLGRFPIVLSDLENYHGGESMKYEILPDKGYAVFFEKLLSHENIEILLNKNVFDVLSFDLNTNRCEWGDMRVDIPICYTGGLEEFFDNGKTLPYRSLKHESRTLAQDSYQPYMSMAYPQTQEYLRTLEYKKMMKNPPHGKTVVTYEYPISYEKGKNEPYYPILTEENIKQNCEYLNRLNAFRNLYPCGRLADYKYYDMDDAIARAFEVFHIIQNECWAKS